MISLVTILFASTIFAAYEFYIVKVSSKNPINWTLVAKAIGSVRGVERTQIDQEKGIVTITCSNQCDASILNSVKSELSAKGITLEIIKEPSVFDDGKTPRVKKSAPAKKAY